MGFPSKASRITNTLGSEPDIACRQPRRRRRMTLLRGTPGSMSARARSAWEVVPKKTLRKWVSGLWSGLGNRRRLRGMSSPALPPPSRRISDELWVLVEPLIPPRRPAIHGRTGRPRTSDREVLEGIAFVLSTGIGWTKLPTELGYGSGWTCWRRMREWSAAGVFDALHHAVLDQLGEHGRLDWSRASLDSVSVRAKRGVH